MALAVRVGARFPKVQKIVAGVILAFASAMFVVGGAFHPASFGGVLFLLLGIGGLALCLGTALLAVGTMVSGRPALVLDDAGVTVPAPWPLPRGRDRALAWADLAAVCAWAQGPPEGRRGAELGRLYLSFLPPGDGMDSGAELLATKITGTGARATLRWTVRIRPSWDATVEEIIAAAKRHHPEITVVDRRELPKPRRKRRTTTR